MLSAQAHGWRPTASLGDTAGMLDEAFEAAHGDPLFGLPEWVHQADVSEIVRRPIVVLGVNEFTYTLLASIEPSRFACLVDDYRQGQELAGIPCMTSEEFYGTYRNSREALFVDCARYGRANLHFRGLALRAGVPTVNFEQAVRLLKPKSLDYRVEDHLPAILEHERAYRDLERRLEDDLSRETLRRVLLYHMTTCRDLYRPVERPYETLYFRSGLFEPRHDERFVDCGASIGESISGLLEFTGFSLDAAWLIEPDRSNVVALGKLLAKFRLDCPAVADRIRLIPSAVGQAAGKVPFRHAGGHGGNVVAAASVDDASVSEVDVVAIDEVVDRPVTMIKMDVEGYELPALRGARDSIASHRPRLCVSAYHRSSDLIDLSQFVLSLRDDYRVGLRHHTPLRWDTCLYFY